MKTRSVPPNFFTLIFDMIFDLIFDDLFTILVLGFKVPLLRIQMTYRGYQSIGCISQNMRVENKCQFGSFNLFACVEISIWCRYWISVLLDKLFSWYSLFKLIISSKLTIFGNWYQLNRKLAVNNDCLIYIRN